MKDTILFLLALFVVACFEGLLLTILALVLVGALGILPGLLAMLAFCVALLAVVLWLVVP